MTTVLHEHDHDHLRIVDRGEAREPGVILKRLAIDPRLDRGLLADDLRRSGLSSRLHSRGSGAIGGATRLVQHSPHATLHDREFLGIERWPLLWRGGELQLLAG